MGVTMPEYCAMFGIALEDAPLLGKVRMDSEGRYTLHLRFGGLPRVRGDFGSVKEAIVAYHDITKDPLWS